MSFKALFKLVVFLVLTFVVIYAAVENRQSASFNFPLVLEKSVTKEAWIIYFGVFAVGVFAGAVLMAGSGKPKGKAWGKGDR